MKKIFLTLTIILVLVSLITGIAVYAADDVVSGTDGTISWSFNPTTGELTISGTGEIPKIDWVEKDLIKSVIIENGITTIGENAFSYCSNLKRITVSQSVTLVYFNAFEECTNLTQVYVDSPVISGGLNGRNSWGNIALNAETVFINKSIAASDYIQKAFPNTGESGNYISYSKQGDLAGGVLDNLSWLFDKTTSKLVISGTGNIPDFTYSMGEAWQAYTIKSVIIENGVTSIGSNAFHGCHDLTDITIPQSITSIGSYVFLDCSNLMSITYGGTEEDWASIEKGASWDGNIAYYSIFYHNHFWSIGEITTPPTHLEEGIKTFTCIECKVTKEEVLPTIPHKYTKFTKHNETQHMKVCECGDEVLAYHSFQGNSGVSTVICTDCGYIYDLINGGDYQGNTKDDGAIQQVVIDPILHWGSQSETLNYKLSLLDGEKIMYIFAVTVLLSLGVTVIHKKKK